MWERLRGNRAIVGIPPRESHVVVVQICDFKIECVYLRNLKSLPNHAAAHGTHDFCHLNCVVRCAQPLKIKSWNHEIYVIAISIWIAIDFAIVGIYIVWFEWLNAQLKLTCVVVGVAKLMPKPAKSRNWQWSHNWKLWWRMSRIVSRHNTSIHQNCREQCSEKLSLKNKQKKEYWQRTNGSTDDGWNICGIN